eukprot:symbB.v1.2.007408.t1/scaffold452.1/size203995/21
MDSHSVCMAVSYVEFLSSFFGTSMSSASFFGTSMSSARVRSYSDETPQASYAPSSPVHWAGVAETECGQGHFEHSKEDKEPTFQCSPMARSTSD